MQTAGRLMLPSMKRVRRQPNPTLRERWNMEPQTTQSLIRSKRGKGPASTGRCFVQNDERIRWN